MVEDYNIPLEIRKQLLPDPTISIHHLLQYILPPLSNIDLGSASSFFGSSDPRDIDDESINYLRTLPVPSSKQIHELEIISHDAINAGFQSMTYRHLHHLGSALNWPLWVLTFWREVVRVREIVIKWTQCRDWLTIQLMQRKSAERRSLAQIASITLTSLPWGKNKPQGLADTLPIHGLWRYLGTNYLSCSEIEDALKLMRTDLVHNPHALMSTTVEGTPFLMFLLKAYRNRNEYEEEHALAWLRSIGDNLVTSNGKLATISSLEPITGEQHWVALVISEGGRKMQYGDSLKRDIPHELQEVVIWWIQYHAPTLNPSLSNLPIIPQIDGHSCGVLAIAAIREALALPLQTTDHNPVILRLHLFNQVCNEILKRLSLSNVEAAATETEANVETEAETEDESNAEAPEVQAKVSKRKLTDYWSIETVDQTRLRNLQSFERLAERGAEEKTRGQQNMVEKHAKRVQANREAQQRSRERKRAKLLEAGWTPMRGRTQKHHDVLTSSSAASLASSPDYTNGINIQATFSDTTVAEISRPRRQFKLDARKNNKPVGRKPTVVQNVALRTNWFMPLLWSNIEQAAVRAGKPWSPRSIVREAKLSNPVLFENLKEQVVGRWIDKEAQARGDSQWLESVLVQVQKNNPGGRITRVGILARYPLVQHRICSQLTSFREAGIALTLVTIRAVMIAIIEDMAPEIYTVQAQDGSRFKCSESFVRKYLHKTLGWSERRATKAAQKLPSNHEEILREAFLREAFIIRDYSVPAALRVNTDQTQLVYQQGSDKTWNLSGVKQVATIGQEEKRAFTLVPSISASGELLPMQAIYMGKTTVSCPSHRAPGYERARELGFQMLPSMTSTYWSTHETMQILVDTIIAPYFERKKRELGLPASQHSIWKIDCWSVHRSASFRLWMKEKHDNIIMVFVPGGCTSLWQPLDVGIQRILKLSMRRSAHRDIVTEVSNQIEGHTDHISIDTTLATLRNRSLQWVINAIDDINNRQLILKAFEMCQVGLDWNLSHQSLTSASALEALRNLPRTNKQLYDELCGLSHSTSSQAQPEAEEPPFTESPEDHSDIPVSVLINTLTGQSHPGFSTADDGSLQRDSIAESEGTVNVENTLPVREGRSKRARKAPVPFGGHELWYEH